MTAHKVKQHSFCLDMLKLLVLTGRDGQEKVESDKGWHAKRKVTPATAMLVYVIDNKLDAWRYLQQTSDTGAICQLSAPVHLRSRNVHHMVVRQDGKSCFAQYYR